MPKHDYFCACCNKSKTILVDLNNRDVQDCEECGNKLDRILSWNEAMKFKGTGFYKTDYNAGIK